MSKPVTFKDENGDLWVLLPGGAAVPKELYEDLRSQVEAAVPTLRSEVTYRIQDLVEPTFWMPQSRYMRRQLGRCLAAWVANGEVALGFVGCPRCNSKRYRVA